MFLRSMAFAAALGALIAATASAQNPAVKIGNPTVLMGGTQIDVPILLTTTMASDSMVGGNVTLDYKAACLPGVATPVNTVGVRAGAALTGLMTQLTAQDGTAATTGFSVNTPMYDRHVVVGFLITGAGQSVFGTDREIVIIRFNLSSPIPAGCKLVWDNSNPSGFPVPTYLENDSGFIFRGTGMVGGITFDPAPPAGRDVCQPTITGSLSYFNMNRPIANCEVKDCSGMPTTNVLPGSMYTLVYNTAGTIQLCANRNTEDGDKDAVTPGDAIRLFRHAAGMMGFAITSPLQLRAGNVTRNEMPAGTDVVDNADAVAVAQWLAFIPGTCTPSAIPNSAGNCTATWVFNFDPNVRNARDRITHALSCTQTIDIRGFFLGDVNGSWPNPANKPLLDSDTHLELAVAGWRDNEVTVDLFARSDGDPIESLQFSLGYDARALQYLGMDRAGSTQEFYTIDNPAQAGVVHGVALGWKGAVETPGALLSFRFRTLGPAVRSRITFSRLKVNDLESNDIPEVELAGPGTSGSLPAKYSLRSSPNPFNPTTRIDYTVPAEAGEVPVALRVYDIAGRLVRKLVESSMVPGYRHVVWNGQDEAARPVSAGIYLVRMQAGEWSGVHKVVLAK